MINPRLPFGHRLVCLRENFHLARWFAPGRIWHGKCGCGSPKVYIDYEALIKYWIES